MLCCTKQGYTAYGGEWAGKQTARAKPAHVDNIVNKAITQPYHSPLPFGEGAGVRLHNHHHYVIHKDNRAAVAL